MRKYHQIFVWQISLHKDLVFQKNNFFTKLFFLANFFNKYFYNQQKNFFRNLRMCELLTNGIVKDFLYHVYALQDLTNIEEQPKSFLLR